MKRTLAYLMSVMIFYGCSSAIKAVPVQIPGAVINEKTGSVTVEKDGIEITAQLIDWNYYPFNLTNYFTPFSITVKNKTTQALNLDITQFVMYDEHKTQYGAYPPKDVYGITSGELYYLIPYPYVGVYQYEGYRQFPTPGSREYPPIGIAGPQLYEIYPRDVYSQAFQFGNLNPDARLHGLVYFKGSILNLRQLRIVVSVVKTDGRKTEFELPFMIK